MLPIPVVVDGLPEPVALDGRSAREACRQLLAARGEATEPTEGQARSFEAGLRQTLGRLERHQPRALPGRVGLLLAATPLPCAGEPPDPVRAWSAYAGDLVVRRVQGDHYGMLTSPGAPRALRELLGADAP